MSVLLHNLLVFGRRLRRLGFDVDPGRMIDLGQALQLVDLRARRDVYHVCRSLLVHRADEIPLFDRAFDAFFSGVPGMRPQPTDASRSATDAPGSPSTGNPHDSPGWAPPSGERAAGGVRLPGHTIEGGSGEQAAGEIGLWSDIGGLASKDFATFTSEEIARGRAALERLAWDPGERRTRRWVVGRGPRLDLRRALATSVRTGGDVVKLPRRHRSRRPRPLVVLCDVSGSMERYSRMLLHFTHSLTRRHRRTEAFLFSTRLTRITMDVRARRLDAAIAGVTRTVTDWAGGTRIGAALEQFHQQWARRVLHHGPVVLLISDGWDRGDPAMLRDQIARLQRGSHRLVWLNPLIGTTGYEPLTRGLQAALPFIDEFLPARTLNDLGDLAVHLNSLAGGSRGHLRAANPARLAERAPQGPHASDR